MVHSAKAIAFAVVVIAVPATGFVLQRASAAATSMSAQFSAVTPIGRETRREMLYKLPLLATPLMLPNASTAATSVKSVWGIDIPLKQDVLQDLHDEGGGVRAAEVYRG